MVELIILNNKFEPIGFIDEFISLIWTRRYYNVGEYELYIDSKYFQLLRKGGYIYSSSFREVGIIETYSYIKEDSQCTIKGRFIEALLSYRVIDKIQNLNGTAENIVRNLVNNFAIANKPINKLQLGNANELGTSIALQVEYENLCEKIYDIVATQDLSIRVKYNYEEDKMYFEVWQGIDRTENQSSNSIVVFSDEYENISTSTYECNHKEYKNFAYVVGEGEGDIKVITAVDLTNGNERREILFEVRDKQDELTIEEYKKVLYQKGIEKLYEYGNVENVNTTFNSQSNLKYKVDYDLGDLCSYVDNELDIVVNQRITEITEVYENNKHDISIVFGKEEKTIMQKLNREVK